MELIKMMDENKDKLFSKFAGSQQTKESIERAWATNWQWCVREKYPFVRDSKNVERSWKFLRDSVWKTMQSDAKVSAEIVKTILGPLLQARSDANKQTGAGGKKELTDIDKAVLAVIGADSAVVVGIAEASKRQEEERAVLEVSCTIFCTLPPDKKIAAAE